MDVFTVAGVLSAIQGAKLVRQASGGAVSVDTGTWPARDTPAQAARIQRSLDVLGLVNMTSGIGLVSASGLTGAARRAVRPRAALCDAGRAAEPRRPAIVPGDLAVVREPLVTLGDLAPHVHVVAVRDSLRAGLSVPAIESTRAPWRPTRARAPCSTVPAGMPARMASCVKRGGTPEASGRELCAHRHLLCARGPCVNLDRTYEAAPRSQNRGTPTPRGNGPRGSGIGSREKRTAARFTPGAGHPRAHHRHGIVMSSATAAACRTSRDVEARMEATKRSRRWTTRRTSTR
jgi:hypothetical protein